MLSVQFVKKYALRAIKLKTGKQRAGGNLTFVMNSVQILPSLISSLAASRCRTSTEVLERALTRVV